MLGYSNQSINNLTKKVKRVLIVLNIRKNRPYHGIDRHFDG